ncbi:MAG: zinc ribbon domain-containing protein [Acidobacteriota bacterium]|nr:zinc ribbon domain-containing protein [Acidobacteriota bacterium]
MTDAGARAIKVAPAHVARTASGLKPWQFFLTASFIGAAAAVWLSSPASPVALVFMSLAIGAAGACATALYAMLSALAGRSAPEAVVSASGRAALEREKLLAVRALKDLEQDRAMGKVSPADAAPLEARLRERAITIMRDLETRESVRVRIERDLADRQATGHRRQATDRRPRATGRCGCGAVNDADARFCKGCGAKRA